MIISSYYIEEANIYIQNILRGNNKCRELRGGA